MHVQTIGVLSQERLKIEVTLLLSANRKSYMPRRLAQQRMTLSDLEQPFHPHRALSLWQLSLTSFSAHTKIDTFIIFAFRQNFRLPINASIYFSKSFLAVQVADAALAAMTYCFITQCCQLKTAPHIVCLSVCLFIRLSVLSGCTTDKRNLWKVMWGSNVAQNSFLLHMQE